MSISIWNYKDYKKYVKSLYRAPEAERGFISRLAEAGGCQPSYLSQVLNSKVQLTPDQACAMATYLRLSESETEYFLILVDAARAGSALLKSRLNTKAESLKTKAQNIGERLQRPTWQAAENQAIYYSSWSWAALHILISIKEFQDLESISRRLKLEPTVALDHLNRLEEMGLVEKKSDQWKHSGQEIHLPPNSPLISVHHNNWRARAVLKSQERLSGNVHFSGVYAISKSDVEKMRELILKAIESANQLARPSESEELVALNCDFFIV